MVGEGFFITPGSRWIVKTGHKTFLCGQLPKWTIPPSARHGLPCPGRRIRQDALLAPGIPYPERVKVEHIIVKAITGIIPSVKFIYRRFNRLYRF